VLKRKNKLNTQIYRIIGTEFPILLNAHVQYLTNICQVSYLNFWFLLYMFWCYFNHYIFHGIKIITTLAIFLRKCISFSSFLREFLTMLLFFATWLKMPVRCCSKCNGCVQKDFCPRQMCVYTGCSIKYTAGTRAITYWSPPSCFVFFFFFLRRPS